MTVIFDGRMIKDATRISMDMLTELAAAFSFTVIELQAPPTVNSKLGLACNMEKNRTTNV